MKVLLAVFLLVPSLLHAQALYMVRSSLSFPEAMAVLQETIDANGYRVSRVQRVDIGLTTFGYKTDKYRVVFFGKPEEIQQLSKDHIEIIPYIPLKIAIFAEGDETILLAAGFDHLRSVYTDDEMLKLLNSWETDIRKMLESVRIAE
jgi:uncharacterized protein (DUF302 family)